MKILITGAGSVMGQSIYHALALHTFKSRPEIHFGNSDELGAGRYFNDPRLPICGRPILPLARDPGYEAALIDYVDENHIDITYPGTQHELAKLSDLRDRFGKYATLPAHLTRLCIDKIRCMEVLKSHGVRVPRSQDFMDYVQAPSFAGPGVVKPNASSASRGILLFDDRLAIPESEIERRRGTDTVVQERLYGDEFTCGCYVDRFSGEKHIICMVRTLTSDGATGWGKVVHDLDIEDYVASIADAFIHEGYDFGHINVQLIRDVQGPCVFEVNGRLSSTEAPKAAFGFNSCAAFLVNLVEEREYREFAVANSGQFLRYYSEVYWK